MNIPKSPAGYWRKVETGHVGKGAPCQKSRKVGSNFRIRIKYKNRGDEFGSKIKSNIKLAEGPGIFGKSKIDIQGVIGSPDLSGH